MEIFLGIMLPFIGTTLGSLMVFCLKNNIRTNIEKFLLGFASGVMIAASIWSLLIPAINMSEAINIPPAIPATVGFLLGIGFLIVLDFLVPNFAIEEAQTKKNKAMKLALAVTLHNIPEGMAIGVVFASLLTSKVEVSLAGAIALSIGIAIQNFPEGAIISMPLKGLGVSRSKAALLGILSGVVEPIAAGITILLAQFLVPILPFLLAFAAGAMIHVVVRELIPDTQRDLKSNIGTIGIALGFVVMMILDVTLG